MSYWLEESMKEKVLTIKTDVIRVEIDGTPAFYIADDRLGAFYKDDAISEVEVTVKEIADET